MSTSKLGGVANGPLGQSPQSRWPDRVLWPVITGLASSLALMLAAGAPQVSSTVMDGCDETQKGSVLVAERRLNADDDMRAEEIGQQVLLLAPDCRCAHLLLAKIHLKRMQRARAQGSAATERKERRLCYAEAIKARDLAGASPQVQGLIDTCSAEQSL